MNGRDPLPPDDDRPNESGLHDEDREGFERWLDSLPAEPRPEPPEPDFSLPQPF